ncbi:MAG TPA: ASKHA domain-containing protein [Candidatus Paceibacterota bacterium]|nr:ASKHA domain-containing protein [Verrucomicrobiota bacterium]HSA10016.1 ASKHA domain-containing protein [Candidatus Paceibacterota bacterium]
MRDFIKIELLPHGKVLRVKRGTALQDVLFAQGVEFPCGGRGQCKGCRIKVLGGTLPITPEERQKLTEPELAEGWRLACRSQALGDLKIELAQWEAAILTDDSVFAFTPQEGLGIAVDLGTTTIVAQLVDLQTGRVLGVRAALNAQARHGADIMSRVEFAVAGQSQHILQNLVRRQIGSLARELVMVASPSEHEVRNVVLVGNTVMHHLFCGVSLEPLSHYPFEPVSPGLQMFDAAQLAWHLPGNPAVRFLPCLGGFVGSDILAGLLATKLHEGDQLAALIDLGTNGEIVVGNRERMLCASTAAGPAFEGARISMGMRAATGAISEVHVQEGRLHCHVLGDVAPRGLCGSGLVDAVAAGLDLGWISPKGRMTQGDSLALAGSVSLSQWDVRELQLAKGAIAAGLRILLDRWGATKDALKHVSLAGAFGNYINHDSARRIGLLDFAADKIRPAGNTALLGAKLALFGLEQQDGAYPDILARIKHLSLNDDASFQETFVAEMVFPEK